jgi:hypothetical protein
MFTGEWCTILAACPEQVLRWCWLSVAAGGNEGGELEKPQDWGLQLQEGQST